MAYLTKHLSSWRRKTLIEIRLWLKIPSIIVNCTYLPTKYDLINIKQFSKIN